MLLDWKTDGAVWQWTGKKNARNVQTGNKQELWQAGSQALIPLVGNNSRFIVLHSQMQIFIHFMRRLSFTSRPAFSASYISYIYLFTKYIIPTDYILTISIKCEGKQWRHLQPAQGSIPIRTLAPLPIFQTKKYPIR